MVDKNHHVLNFSSSWIRAVISPSGKFQREIPLSIIPRYISIRHTSLICTPFR